MIRIAPAVETAGYTALAGESCAICLDPVRLPSKFGVFAFARRARDA